MRNVLVFRVFERAFHTRNGNYIDNTDHILKVIYNLREYQNPHHIYNVRRNNMGSNTGITFRA